jgi:hypothetical protein
MTEITHTTEIEASPGSVFSYLADEANATTYVPGLISWSPVTPGASGLGASYRAKISTGKLTYSATLHVSAWEQDRVIEWTIGGEEELAEGAARDKPGLRQRLRWTLAQATPGEPVPQSCGEGNEERTEAVLVVEVELPRGIAGSLLGVTVIPLVRSKAGEALAGVKREVERLARH